MTFEGVIKRTITKGDGKTFPKPGDTVEMHYNGHALSKSADGANIIGRK